MASKIRGVTPKCSNHNYESDSTSNSGSTSNFHSRFASSSNSNLISYSDFTSNPSPTSNSNLTSNSSSIPSSTSNSNPTSKSSYPDSFTSNSTSIPSSPSISNPTCRFTNTKSNIKFDLTNKAFNRCRVIKEITCFVKKKAICKECNATKVKCEHFTAIISFSWLKGHIKKFHEETNLPRGVYSVKSLLIK